MVTPYLSRLRPAEPGRLRPRPRSRFEPAPRLPIDGPALDGLSLSAPPTPALVDDVEAELSPDPADPHRSAQAATASPADRTAQQAVAAAPEPTAPDEQRAPAATEPRLRGPVAAAMPHGDTGPGRGPPGPDLAGDALTVAAPSEQTARPPQAQTPPPTAALANQTTRPPRTQAPPPTATLSEPTTRPSQAQAPSPTAALGNQTTRSARTEAPPPTATLSEPTTRSARSGPAGTPAPPDDRPAPSAWTVAPGPTGLDEGRVPVPSPTSTRPPLRSPTLAAMPAEQASAGNQEGLRGPPAEAIGREHAPALESGAPPAAPRHEHVRPDQAPVLRGRATSAEPLRAEPTPPEPVRNEQLSPAPRRSVNRTSQAGDSGVPGESAQTDRVQAMARWLGDAGDAVARSAVTTGPSIGRQSALAPVPRGLGWPEPAAGRTDVTVTIGRIEVKAPAPDPAPTRPQSSRPRQRVPSLNDYLESRTRARSGLG